VECKSEEAKNDARFGVLWQTSGFVTAKWGSSEPKLTHSIDWRLDTLNPYSDSWKLEDIKLATDDELEKAAAVVS
jgi:hypothetical protein